VFVGVHRQGHAEQSVWRAYVVPMCFLQLLEGMELKLFTLCEILE
jgi:hypothetical protein